MRQFRKKPVIIEAQQWPQDGSHDRVCLIKDHLGQTCLACPQPQSEHGTIDTLEGTMKVCPGDWIIKGIKGEFYPCKPDVFDKIYELVEKS